MTKIYTDGRRKKIFIDKEAYIQDRIDDIKAQKDHRLIVCEFDISDVTNRIANYEDIVKTIEKGDEKIIYYLEEVELNKLGGGSTTSMSYYWDRKMVVTDMREFDKVTVTEFEIVRFG